MCATCISFHAWPRMDLPGMMDGKAEDNSGFHNNATNGQTQASFGASVTPWGDDLDMQNLAQIQRSINFTLLGSPDRQRQAEKALNSLLGTGVTLANGDCVQSPTKRVLDK